MKYECKSCGLECSIEANFEPTVCLKTGIICYGWHKVIAPAPKPLSDATGLQRLTVEVFDREDCPEWVKCAAVNMDRTAFFFGNVPNRGCSNPRRNYWSYHHSEMMQIPGQFDPSDWQNSLIMRPEKKKLPDWCKVGAWVWNDEFGFGRVVNPHLLAVSIDWVKSGIRGGALPEQLTPAHVRPWTFEEAPTMLKVRRIRETDSFDVLTLSFDCEYAEPVRYFATARNEYFGASSILEIWEQLSGEPCGVLEVEEVSK